MPQLVRVGKMMGRNKTTAADPAAAYFAAAGITDATEKSAVSTLIASLKSANLWNSLDYVFPFSPTSFAAAAYCCKSLTQLTFINTPTHSSSGVQFVSASSQYALTAGNTDTLTNFSVSSGAGIYLTAVGALSGSQYTFGSSGNDIADQATAIYFRQNTTSIVTVVRGNAQATQAATSIVPAHYYVSRIADNNLKSYKNGVQASSSTSTLGVHTISANLKMAIGCLYFAGSPFAASYFPETVAFFVMGAAFDATQQLDLYNAIQAYQTSLGRNV